MSAVYIDQVRASLEELSDAEYQSRVWTGRGGGNEMSSFVECVERLFSDSGLGDALEAGDTGLGPAANEQLVTLRRCVARIDGGQEPDALIAHSRMRLVRERAAAILRAIDDGAVDAS